MEKEVWTPQTIRDNVDNWSLASDAALLGYLEKFSERLQSRAKNTLENLDGLFTSLAGTKIALSNVTNEFMNMHHTQFIENRVYEEDETITEDVPEIKKKSEGEQSTENVELMRKALQEGLAIMNKHFERIEVPNSDSDEESEGPSIIVRAKDFYTDRPLPYVIGTDEWYASDDCGLKPAESLESLEEEEPGLSFKKRTDSTSESSLEMPKSEQISNPPRPSEDIFGSDTEEEKSPTSNFASELSAKLGNINKTLPSDREVYGEPKVIPKKPIIKKEFFADEPPPLDEVDPIPVKRSVGLFDDADDSSDLWTDTTQKGLFDDDGDDLFSKTETKKRILPEGPRIIVPLISDQPPPTEEEVKKKPLGGVSMLGPNAEIKKFLKRVPSSDEEENTKKSLFSDDDDDEVTARKKPLGPDISKILRQRPPSSDSDNEEVVVQKKKPVGGVSMIGPNAEISKILKQRPPSSDSDEESLNFNNSGTKSFGGSKIEDVPKKISLFSDDEDIIAKEPPKQVDAVDFSKEQTIEKSKPKKIVDVPPPLETKASKKISLFSDDEDMDSKYDSLFGDDDLDFLKIPKKKTSLSFYDDEPPPLDDEDEQPPAPSTKKVNLFQGIDEDLFKQNLKPNTKTRSVNLFGDEKPIETPRFDLFGDINPPDTNPKPEDQTETIKSEPITTETPITKPRFDVFGDISQPDKPKPEDKSKPSTTDTVRTSERPITKPRFDVFGDINQPDKPKPDDQPKPTASETKSSEPIKILTDKLFQDQSLPKLPKEIPGKLSHDLKINVGALLPGSKRPKSTSDVHDFVVKPEMIKSASLDDPIETVPVLQNLNQERVKIPIKRRPSSRRARIQAIRSSQIENETQPENIEENEVREEDGLNGNNVEDNEKVGDNSNNNKGGLNLFAEFTEQMAKVTPDAFLNDPPAGLDNDTKLADPSLKIDPVRKLSKEEKKETTIFDEDSSVSSFLTDPSFEIIPKVEQSKTMKEVPKQHLKQPEPKSNEKTGLPSFLLDNDPDFDVFEKLNPAPTRQGISKAALSLFDDDDTTDDIFEALKSKKVTPKSNPPSQVKIQPSSLSSQPQVKKVSTRSTFHDSDSDDLFEPKASIAPTKIQPSSSKAEKVSQPSKKSMSLFGDESDEDLFGSTSTKKVIPKIPKVIPKEKVLPKRTSLFDSDGSDDDLFGSKFTKGTVGIKADSQIKKPESKVVFDDPLMSGKS